MTEQTLATPPAAATDSGPRHVFRIEVPDLGVMISGAGTRKAIARNLRWAADCTDGGSAGAVPDTGHQAAADLPARLRFAYSEAAHLGWRGVAATLLDLAGQLEPGDDDDSDEVCAAIARALASASPSGDTANPEETR